MFDHISNPAMGPDISLGSQAAQADGPPDKPVGNGQLGLQGRILANRGRNAPSQKQLFVAAIVTGILAPLAEGAGLTCPTNCHSCWGTLSNQCMSCNDDYILMSFECIDESTGCDSGYTLDDRDGICKRTINDIDNPCEPGTYNNQPSASLASSCLVCTPGFACEIFATTVPYDCQAGYYCASRSTLRSPVVEYADDYTTVSYGPIAGVTNWWNYIGVNVAAATTYTNGDICERGNYCGLQSTDMTSCPAGWYCPDDFMQALDQADAANDELKCHEGFYCSGSAYSKTPGNDYPGVSRSDGATGGMCSAGAYCPENSSREFTCDPGDFNPNLMGVNDPDDCKDCPYGRYCPASGESDITGDSYKCQEGYYCEANALTPTQNACGYDEYCIEGSRSPVQCEPEEWTDGTKKGACEACDDGKRCQQGTASSCAAGTYCFENTITYCEPGKYGEDTNTGQHLESAACATCPAGYACRQPNNKYFCAAGWLCSGSTKNERPNVSTEGGQVCEPGTYCPSGSASAVTTTASACDAGRYCPNYAAQLAAGQCLAGHYCPPGSTSPTANMCQPGHYCTLGTGAQEECPAGTYMEGSGATSAADCKDCPSGVACPYPGLTHAPIFVDPLNPAQDNVCSITNETPGIGDIACEANIEYCQLGFFCPAGTTDSLSGDSAPQSCPKGYRCDGSRAKILCEAGYYQDEVEQSVCKICGSAHLNSAGYYCDGSDPTSEGSLCPAGRYCPSGVAIGTKHADEYPCPIGRFSSATGNYEVDQCDLCTLGYYCQFKGQTAATTPIKAGWHGNNAAGQVKPNPFRCPATAYCDEASGAPTGCPDGMWTPSAGATSISDCIPCERGTWCRFKTMWDNKASNGFQVWAEANPEFTWEEFTLGTYDYSNSYGECDQGYICLEGATQANPTDASEGYQCLVGHYCPVGAIIDLKCKPGYYNGAVGAAECDNCPAGRYCPDFGMTEGVECEAGSYCPGEDATGAAQIRPTPCPAGTHDSPAGASLESQCVACLAGQFCDTPGQIQTSGNCDSGFICVSGDDRPGPFATSYVSGSQSGRCNEGNSCGAGDTEQTPCPTRYYAGKEQSSECHNCPPGKYCTGGVNVATCSEGYYCKELSDQFAPDEASVEMGGICPNNTFCIQGAGRPQDCSDGQKQDSEGQTSCDACTIGKICRAGGSVQEDCPNYHYCDGNTTYPRGKLCEMGFYGEVGEDGLGYDEAEDCLACPQGMFCTGGQRVGDCAAGYICLEEADSHTPNSTALEAKAYPCPLGYYCEEGVEVPERCPGATYTFDVAAKQEGECTICQMGWYCPNNDTYTEPVACPAGTYCGFGRFQPQTCPRGTYQQYQNKGQLSDCLPCPGGYNCDESGIGNVIAAGDRYACPLGHYCPEGINYDPVPCIAGSYLDNLSEQAQQLDFIEVFQGSPSLADDIEDCSFCPRGYTCPEGTGYRYQNPCPPKYLCPAGSGIAVLCPPGWYCEGTGEGLVESAECPEGFFCPAGTEVPSPCSAEQICPKKSSSPETRGMTPEDCEPGTYLNVDRCIPCEPGHVCDYETSQKYPIDLDTEGGYECPPGNYCPRGTTSETIQKCPVGTHRLEPKGKSLEDCATCPAGSSQNKEGQPVCILCGRGSEAADDTASCNCVGAFRTWQSSTNECVCQAGYQDAVITEEQQTSTQDLDCRPILLPECTEAQFTDNENKCIDKSSCEGPEYCNGAGGVYDENLGGCFCNDVSNEPDDYCDSACEYAALKVYYTDKDTIYMQAGGLSRDFPLTAFGEAFLLDGLSCNIELCPITSQKLVDGQMVSSEEASADFVDFWRENVSPGYISPYPQERRRLAEKLLKLRRLQPEPVYFSQDPDETSSFYFDIKNDNENDRSYIKLLMDGGTVTSWSSKDLNKHYSLSTAGNWKSFQAGGTTPGTADGTESTVPVDENGNPVEEEQLLYTDQTQLEAAASSSSTYVERTIQCIEPGDGVSFEVSGDNYPVYIKDSKYNTDKNYDYGAFSVLRTKLTNAKLAISSFLVTFPDAGVFTFGDNESPFTPQTLVLATKDKAGLCGGRTQWPLTSENMSALGITKSIPLMRQFDHSLYYIPPFFIVVAFLCCGCQGLIEWRIEAAEVARRMRREKASATLKKYFKKKQDKFDKVDYLGDMYKLIQQTVAEIKKEIAKNQRLTEEENRDNMNKMLKDKYSVIKDLARSGGDKDIEHIKARIQSMLSNLRFADGRSLQEVLEAMKMQEAIEAEEAQLRAMEEAEQAAKEERNSSDSFVSEQLSESEEDSMISKSSKDGSSKDDADREKEEDQELNQLKANGDLADDVLAHKAALRKKREEFIASLDEHLSPKMKEDMLKHFDNQQLLLAESLKKEQQDQDARLQARLNARKRAHKKISVEAGKDQEDKQQVVTEIQDRIDALIVEKENIEEKGVNTKAMKAEREDEYQKRMDALNDEQNQKIAMLREDYLNKIKKAKNPQEKDKLLEEMGKRLQKVEGDLADEKARQEAALQKMLKARQKKNLKGKVKDMSKEVDQLEEQIDKLKANMDTDKAQVYAEQGSAAGLLDHDVSVKKQRLANGLDENFKGLDNELTQVEKDDIEIHKTQLQMEKEKELNSAAAEIEEEVIKSHKARDLEEQKNELRAKLEAGDIDPSEKQKLMDQVNELERNLSQQMHADRQNQDRNLEEKRKKRAELLAIKKMQIEANQVEELNKKDLETMNNKFLGQMEAMDKHTEKELDREIRSISTRIGPGKEQALIVVNEAHDDLLERKLKILMSKQFGDLTKYLGSMQNQLMMEHMIRARKLEMKFENEKEAAIHAGMSEGDLADRLQMLAASRDLEINLSEQKLQRDKEEREQLVREGQEEKFCEEKKDLIAKQSGMKRRKIQQTMDKMPDNEVVQEVGNKLLKRLDQSVEDEMAEADKLKDQNLERARMKIVAENEKQIDDMKASLNEAMIKEEKKLDQQMNQRRDQILTLKRANLEERLKMAGDMTAEQIKELRAQYEREYNNLEKAISEEKSKQLANMRAAMLSRRIAKERKRRIAVEEAEAARSRAQVAKMTSGLAKAFRNMIASKMGGMSNLNKATVLVDGDDRLRARLAAWQRAVDEARGYRGGEDGEIWNIGAAREAEKSAKAEAKRLKEIAKAERDQKISYTVQELYKRIMRVERLAELLDGGKNNTQKSNLLNGKLGSNFSPRDSNL